MNIAITTFAIGLLLPCLVSAHGGGLDAHGGHTDRKANNYHFHQGLLDGQTYASKDAATQALVAIESGEESDDGSANPPDPIALPLFDLTPYRPSHGPGAQIVGREVNRFPLGIDISRQCFPRREPRAGVILVIQCYSSESLDWICGYLGSGFILGVCLAMPAASKSRSRVRAG